MLLAEDRYASPELALGRPDSHDHEVKRQICAPRDLRLIADVTLRNLFAVAAGERPLSSDDIR